MKINEIPFNFASCYATAEQCGQVGNCLRHRVAALRMQQPTMGSKEVCVAPKLYVRNTGEAPCMEFRSCELLKYARGMRQLFREVPFSKYPSMREAVMNAFPSERSFYRAQAGEKLITPNLQGKIEAIFEANALPIPRFDAYEFHPAWEL